MKAMLKIAVFAAGIGFAGTACAQGISSEVGGTVPPPDSISLATSGAQGTTSNVGNLRDTPHKKVRRHHAAASASISAGSGMTDMSTSGGAGAR